MPDGRSVFGVFTRDYRHNTLNSQVTGFEFGKSVTLISLYLPLDQLIFVRLPLKIWKSMGNASDLNGLETCSFFVNTFKVNPLPYESDCVNFSPQILVTVPQCLEILFISPNRQHWTKNVKYVIFDEVNDLHVVLLPLNQ